MAKQKSIRVLLAEDDPNLSILVCDYLRMLGYKVECAADGHQALQKYLQTAFDLCIFDVMMPRIDGFELAKQIRQRNSSIPIIFLTARGQNEDRVKGFRMGCDDYITKPFDSEELSLRIEAILKRCGILIEEENYELGTYVFDAVNMLLSRQGITQSLTTKESGLLRLLCRNTNALVTREKALKEVWGDENYFVGRSMDVFISRLRKYLQDEPVVQIVNVHGAGFKLEIKSE